MTRPGTMLNGFDASVPANETPRARCPYCERPFRDEDLCALHLGESHWEACTDAEREAYEEAYDAESDALFLFQLKVVAALVFLSLGLTYTYAIVWT
ncbi:hypothetical protein BRC68_00645 [Halobacteriales archaeon QH_6_64_20]|nr:MAG: hypothetical protein BRC68_00645 [Halobacteriales archaeon QH_6_64_20]